MKLSRRRLFSSGFSALGFARPALAQDHYPARPIHLVVPFAAGGGADVVSRILADNLTARLGVPVTVDNRPGGGSILGIQYVAHALPNGYTLLMASPALAINARLYRSPGFDLEQDFEPVAAVVASALVLVVPASSPFHDVEGLIAGLRARPEGVCYASAGIGSTDHLAAEMLAQRVGVTSQHLPRTGSGPAVEELTSGRAAFLFGAMAGLLPAIKTGQVRALAQTGAERWDGLADVPIMAEAGVPDFVIPIWNGILAPRGMPPGDIVRLSAEIDAAAVELTPRFASVSATRLTMRRAEFAALIHSQIALWGEVIRAAGLQVN